MEALVTGIITTYKRPPEIVKRAAESVLNQTYKNLELIIVDDSPDDYELRDAVKAMALDLKGRVKYVQHEINQGACAARNTGIAAASGEFIAFLDDDDEWLEKKIEKQMEAFIEDEIALVYCGNYVVNDVENWKRDGKRIYMNGYVYDFLILENFIGSTSYPVVRKKVLDELGGFNINMKAAQDFELWLRIARKYKINYVKEALVNYYIHNGEQITDNYHNKLEAMQKVIDLNMDYLNCHRKAYATRILRMVPICTNVDRKKAIMLFFKAIMIYPFRFSDMLKAIESMCALYKKVR